MFADSTFLIDFLRGDRAAIQIVEKTQTPLFTSEINIFELVQGVYASGINAHSRLEKVFALIAKLTVLPFDRSAALRAGMISGKLSKEGKKIGEVDCLIAGVALSHGITKIATKNGSHFDKIHEMTVVHY
ncbi:PIN domain-containing protein [Candidatus Woesearchaeota archaeon]|nr:PIN domain-containing protein [Candidatus Woesearchaeota archaeon]